MRAAEQIILLGGARDVFSGLPIVTPTSLGWTDSGGLHFALATDKTITNQNLNVAGCTITGAGRIILSGTAALTGNGTLSNGAGVATGAVFIQDSGAYKIAGVTFAGVSATACIAVNPSPGAVISPLTITNNTFSNSNYGVLRGGGNGTINPWTISGNTISTMQGDGIEWNVCPLDRNGTISGNHISAINNTNSQPNWGIGIGIAGLSYTNNFAVDQSAQSFTISNNTIAGARVGIHVEMGINFAIYGNVLTDISATYSPASGLEEAGIVAYGCNQYSINNNRIANSDVGNGIYILPGVISAVYVGLPDTFTVDRNVLDNASTWFTGVQWSTSGTPTITNNSGHTFQSFGSIPAGFTGGGPGNVWVVPWASN